MDSGVGKMGQVMQELMPRFRRNGMSLRHRQMGTDGHIEFRVEPMTQPPDAHLGHLLHVGYVLHGVFDLFDHRRVYAI